MSKYGLFILTYSYIFSTFLLNLTPASVDATVNKKNNNNTIDLRKKRNLKNAACSSGQLQAIVSTEERWIFISKLYEGYDFYMLLL